MQTSEFTRAFARHMRDVMGEHGVLQRHVQAHLITSPGHTRSQAFVSERTSGQRPVDTDIIAAVAAACGMPAHELVAEIVGRIRAAASATASIVAVPARQAHAPNPSRGVGSEGSRRTRKH